jgi:hypothetical protein
MGADVSGQELYAGVIRYMTDPTILRIIGAGDDRIRQEDQYVRQRYGAG